MTSQQTPAARPANMLRLLIPASLAYLVFGLAGLALAIPPGYASPIFPAAGFAAAIMLWSSRRAWPAIALGSLLLNLIAGDLGEAARATTLVTALGIATGATVQAYVTASLVQRVVGQAWRTLEFAGDIVRVLALAGPLACVISASVGVATLYFNGLTPVSDVLFTWWNWWAGDTLGVLVALPLSLAWLMRSDTPWRKRPLALGLPMLVTLAVIAAGYFAVSRWERSEQDLAVRRHGEQLARVLEQRFIAHQEALAALKRLIEVSPDMSYAQFDRFTRVTLRDNPDIFALSFNPYVRLAERAALERRMALATGKADFEVKERDAQKRLVRAADRADYVAVGYIAPLQGNLPAIGYDINSEPVRQDAIRRARESRRPSVTATIQLVQENQKRVGALLLHPAYAATHGGDGLPSDSTLTGFAVGVIKLDQMVQIATDPARVLGLAFEIDDISDRQRGKVFRSDAEAGPRHQAGVWRMPLAMADRTWELSVYPTAAYQPEHRPWIAWATGVVGLLLAALFQILLLVTTGHAAATERKVKRQSEELETQTAELQVRNALINTLFDVSPDGFVALAPDGTVRLANPAFHRLTGIPPAEIVGLPLGELDRRLRLGAEQPERYVSLESLFAGDGDVPARNRLVLVRPQEVVLQIVGVRGVAASIDRFAYFRDVTHEAEVDRMKSEFLSHAAHELRTPMASIYGFTELLMNQEFDEATRKDLLATIHKQTQWLVDIINELLDLARIESRRGKDFSIEALPLPPLMNEVLSAMQIDPSRWPLAIGPAPDLPAIRADAAKLRQALTNVLGNAVKYSPRGGAIEIHYATRDTGGQAFVGVSVTDHGIGMRRDQVARVCERFYRADTSGKIPGTGLGMSIVKEIVELLGGQVEIVSEPGIGTSITLWLPAGVTGAAKDAPGPGTGLKQEGVDS
jgi:signal transduction histidine kinase/integral membrane sensor domain MASE1